MTAPIRHPYLDHPGPIAFAHRGGAADGMENTMAQFRRAVESGYRYIETDVHATLDGKLVAFHDATLDRMTDGAGRIADLPWKDVRHARVAGVEPVPLFEELLETFPEVRWNIDIKAEPALHPLLNLIARTDSWDRVCVGSFSEPRVARAQRLAGPRLATSYGTSGVLGLRLRSWASRRGCVVRRSPRRCRSRSPECRWQTISSCAPPTRTGSMSMCGP